MGGKANTKHGACNVEFDPGMKMVATRKIEPGEEIFADYGPGYSWEEYDGEREGWTFARRRGGKDVKEGGKIRARVTRENIPGREEEDGWRWVRPTIMRKRWRSGGRTEQESDEEDEEGVGGDRGGGLEEGGDGEGGEDGTRGEGGAEEMNARRGAGGRGGRLITRAPIGLRLRWMIEGKGPPWAQR